MPVAIQSYIAEHKLESLFAEACAAVIKSGSPTPMAVLRDWFAAKAQQETLQMLEGIGQGHLASAWPADASDTDKARFFAQVAQLESSYPGGLAAYVANGRKLLADSKSGVNPLEGWSPTVPTGTSLKFASAEYLEHEAVGLSELDGCSFVLVAGGLGERLGFSGIKVALPFQISTDECYLQLYVSSILALQKRAAAATGKPVTLPLAIMVSGDTAQGTEELLRANDYFGMQPSQVTLLKQEKVPCLADNDARLAADPKDPFKLLTKPHGHGDVHYLLHSSGTVERWQAAGVRWVYFFQDTNAPAFKVLPACLAVSKKLGMEVNSVCVGRKAGEAIGGIMQLNNGAQSMTVNVEYNQIDALLKATVEPRGDVDGPDGYSPWPGSINQLIFALAPYAAKLKQTGGGMPEFVNPKYTDGTKTAFKAPTRLECMMQDYPKSLGASAVVGFSSVTDTVSFSPVKTNLKDARVKSDDGMPTYSAASGEADIYLSNCQMLQAAGVVLPDAPTVSRGGIKVSDVPRLVVDPTFGVTISDWKAKLPTPGAIKLAPGSTLVLRGDLTGLTIESLELSGTLVVQLVPGAKLTIRSVKEQNDGWAFADLDGEAVPEPLAIRGYKMVKSAQRELIYDIPGTHVVDDGK